MGRLASAADDFVLQYTMSTQILMALVYVMAMWASSLAQVTADLGQNNPAAASIQVKDAKLRVLPPAPTPSVISVPTVPPAAVPAPPSTLLTSRATPNRLYKTPRQRERDSAATDQPDIMKPSLRDAFLLAAVASPAPPPTPSQTEGMPYEFMWSVQDATSGSFYRHEERSDGKLAQGEYRVLLPDGRLQVVTFTDRGQGYEAQVVYQDYDGF